MHVLESVTHLRGNLVGSPDLRDVVCGLEFRDRVSY